MFYVESYDERGVGFEIDEESRWRPITLPNTRSLGTRTCGFGTLRGPLFIAFYIQNGAFFIQLNTKRWPVLGSQFSLDRRGERFVLIVQRDGARVDELEYTPGWHDASQEMLISHADLGDSEFDLGSYIVETCSPHNDLKKLARVWEIKEPF